MKVGRFGVLACSLVGVFGVIGATWSPGLLAQAEQGQSLVAHDHTPNRNPTSEFIKQVREATERFKDVSVADAEEYKLAFGCVSGGEFGAMGMHFVNMELVGDGKLDVAKPEILLYEPLPNGGLKLTGADYLITKEAWHTNNPTAGQPELGGQLLHLFTAPNRFGLPDFYTLHVWAWKESPTGMFVNWHSKISCESFSGNR